MAQIKTYNESRTEIVHSENERTFAVILNTNDFEKGGTIVFTGTELKDWIEDNGIDLLYAHLICGVNYENRTINHIDDMLVGDMLLLDAVEIVYFTRID